MAQTLALYHGAGEPDVELVIVVKMREGFAAVEESSEPVVAPGDRTILGVTPPRTFRMRSFGPVLQA